MTVDLTQPVHENLRNLYEQEADKAGGTWYSYVTVPGTPFPVIDQRSDAVIHAASTNKVAMAVALLAEVDRGVLRLDQHLTLRADMISHDGGGLYHLQTTYGDRLTLANVITCLVVASDDTAVGLVAEVLPGAALNRALDRLGFTSTRVELDPDRPGRFFHGTTTPRETHTMLARLAGKTLLSRKSCEFLLNIMTWSEPGYTDGIRRNMSSQERHRVATKYGAYEDERHEAGVMFTESGRPALIYTFYANELADGENYGATHPAVQAHATLGRALFDVIGQPSYRR